MGHDAYCVWVLTSILVSPFVLSNVADLSTVHLVLDAALLALPGSTLLAFRQGAADKTIFITVDDLKAYFKSLNKDAVEIDFKELAAAAAAAKPANKPAGNKAAAKPAKDGKERGIRKKKTCVLMIYIISCSC